MITRRAFLEFAGALSALSLAKPGDAAALLVEPKPAAVQGISWVHFFIGNPTAAHAGEVVWEEITGLEAITLSQPFDAYAGDDGLRHFRPRRPLRRDIRMSILPSERLRELIRSDRPTKFMLVFEKTSFQFDAFVTQFTQSFDHPLVDIEMTSAGPPTWSER